MARTSHSIRLFQQRKKETTIGGVIFTFHIALLGLQLIIGILLLSISNTMRNFPFFSSPFLLFAIINESK